MRTPGRSHLSRVALPVALLLLATPPNSGAITLTPASGCTSTQPANFTCSDARKLKSEVPVSEFASCNQARITCSSTSNTYTEDLNCYIFSNLTAATQYERYTSSSPALGSYISGCAEAQNCDMPFVPSEVLKSSNVIYLFADKDYSSSKGGIVISAECIGSGASGVGGSNTERGCRQSTAGGSGPSPAKSPDSGECACNCPVCAADTVKTLAPGPGIAPPQLATCNSQVGSGNQSYTEQVFIINVAASSAVNLTYNTYDIPDRYRIINPEDNTVVLDTGFVGKKGLCTDGPATAQSPAKPGIGSATASVPTTLTKKELVVSVTAPCFDTAWEFRLDCIA